MPKEWLTRSRAAQAAALLAALAFLGGPARAEDKGGETVSVERAVDGDTLALAGGGVLRLAGILAPKRGDRASGPRAEREVAAAAEAAQAALDALARGQKLRLVFGALREDRHGRRLAQVRDESGRWLQDELLRQGHARVFTAGGAARAAEMLKIEDEARTARRGIWALPAYAVRADDEAGRHADSFQIVEGRVLKAASARTVFYLNFDRDFRRDFTVGVERGAVRAFRRAGLDLATLEGKRIRVRGWVIWRNGPYIDATHPDQIEIVD
jgi:endonuclease YncB( thermonuclease family)